MKIAFFSNIKGRNAVTSNLACISIMNALKEKRKAVLFENHFNLNSLEQAFFPIEYGNELREENDYYRQEGLDGLMRGVHSGMMRPSLVRNAVKPVLRNQVYFVPGSRITDGTFFTHEFSRVMKPLFTMLEDFGDNVYIDTGGTGNQSTELIIQEADLVVVNLSQNPSVIAHFFENYTHIMDKSIYLLGNYQEESRYNRNNLSRRYPIDRKKLAVIPYNIDLHDAMQEGKLVSFLSRNYKVKKGERHYGLMTDLERASELVLAQIDQLQKRKGEGKVYGRGENDKKQNQDKGWG